VASKRERMTWLLGGYSKHEIDEKLIQRFGQKTVQKDINYVEELELSVKMIQYSNYLK
jgi:hypothetical protein